MDVKRSVCTVQEAAQRMGCREPYVYQLIQEGRLTAFRLGKRALRVSQESIERFMAGGETGPGDRSPAGHSFQGDRLLRFREVQDRLSASEPHVYELINSGELVAVRIGKRALRVSEKSISRFMTSREVDPETFGAE